MDGMLTNGRGFQLFAASDKQNETKRQNRKRNSSKNGLK